MSMPNGDQSRVLPEGVFSLLDTDLYKLTMQCCVLMHFSDIEVTYNFTNRTPNLKLNRAAVKWLQKQIDKLANIRLSDDELQFLRTTCKYLNEPFLRFLSALRLRPSEQVHLTFTPVSDTGSDDDQGDINLKITGLWVDTILYEIPLLALVSEAYFKFCDKDWSHEGQLEQAKAKGLRLLEGGCLLAEFGSRRRRDYHTHELVLQGLCEAQREAQEKGFPGKLTGTSNVHLAMRFGIPPSGTVAHEWFMGVAAITNDYENANEIALQYWVATFGEGVLGIALTDTFGTPQFLKAFKKPCPDVTSAQPGPARTSAAAASSTTTSSTATLSNTEPPVEAPLEKKPRRTYAQTFAGTRQDSGDPEGFVKMMRKFYDEEGITDKKIIVFSDSLNVDRCFEYKQVAEDYGFQPTFGVGTYLTNDFARKSDGKKSVPLNIVIKLGSAAGRPAVKISDNIGKNTGDQATVEDVKRRLHYVEKEWADGDEKTRWGKEGDQADGATSIKG